MKIFLILIDMKTCKIILIQIILLIVSAVGYAQKNTSIKISRSELENKIKGGWAGQTIGVSYGSYTEFRFQGTFIQDYQPIPWHDGYVKELMYSWPDLFDDVYMDLTFVDVLEKYGMDAPVDSFANAFAYAGYNLWHANQAARYNIIHGIKPPLSGNWLHNPHADDIDFQIEADFSGLMNPAMPYSASAVCDKIGHIMNYGDGWYGGVFVGTMYTLSFVSKDINYIVTQALKAIPKQSTFYQCVNDVIKWHKKYPNDWEQTWFEIQKKWSKDIGCPDGVFTSLDIDAKINAAYVVMGLLYGNGDFGKTLEIATRAGQDSDCNPSTAGGILGAMLGYDKIPDYLMNGLHGSETINFKYTDLSLNDVYKISTSHALKMIEKNGGTVGADFVYIPFQTPRAVRYEKSFDGLIPVIKETFNHSNCTEIDFEFEGTGFVLRGDAVKKSWNAPQYVFDATFYIDGVKEENAKLYTDFKLRRCDLFWKYNLPQGKHKVKMVIDNPNQDYDVRTLDYIVYK